MFLTLAYGAAPPSAVGTHVGRASTNVGARRVREFQVRSFVGLESANVERVVPVILF